MNSALAPLVLAVGAYADLAIEPVPADAPEGFSIVFSKHVDGNLAINVNDLLAVIAGWGQAGGDADVDSDRSGKTHRQSESEYPSGN